MHEPELDELPLGGHASMLKEDCSPTACFSKNTSDTPDSAGIRSAKRPARKTDAAASTPLQMPDEMRSAKRSPMLYASDWYAAARTRLFHFYSQAELKVTAASGSLGTGLPFGILLLVLFGGLLAYGCWLCLFLLQVRTDFF